MDMDKEMEGWVSGWMVYVLRDGWVLTILEYSLEWDLNFEAKRNIKSYLSPSYILPTKPSWKGNPITPATALFLQAIPIRVWQAYKIFFTMQ